MRKTKADLYSIVERLNVSTGSATEPYTRNPDGTNTANPGTYVLHGAYGGWKLHRFVDGGGERDVLLTGFLSPGQLYERIDAYMRGIWDAQKEKA